MNINGTSGTPGLNVNELFNSGLDSISSKGKDLQAKMTEMLGKDEVSPEDMMALQFEVGQYNAMLESLSVRHEEHDGYDEEPCPAYRLSLSPSGIMFRDRPRMLLRGPSRTWRVGRDDRTRRRGCPLLPFLRLAGGAPGCPHLFTIGETPCCPIPRSAVCLMSPTLHVTEETWWMRVPCTRGCSRSARDLRPLSWARP